VSGWRLDVPLEVKTPGFWQEFRQRVKAVSADAYLVAEIWDDASHWLDGESFDAAMNYPLYRACLGFFGGADLDQSFRPGGYGLSPLGGVQFADQIDRSLRGSSREAALAQLNLLGSHDTPRLLTLLRCNRQRARLAALFQMTFVGAPCIYYGDEIGMEGGNDPDCRRAYPLEFRPQEQELRDWYRRLLELRRRFDALRRGEYLRLSATPTTFAFARRLGPEVIVVAQNVSTEAAGSDIPVAGFQADGRRLRDELTGDVFTVEAGFVRPRLPALGGVVLVGAGTE
jgi:glycosidase